MIESPQIRPGKADAAHEAAPTVVAFFPNAAQANSVIQLVIQLGVPSSRLGVTPPDAMPRGQGMLVTIPCPDDVLRTRVEAICRAQGAAVHGQRI